MSIFSFSFVDSATIATIAAMALLVLSGLYRVFRTLPSAEPQATEVKSYYCNEILMEGEISDDTTDHFEIDGLRAYTHSKASSSVNLDFFEVKKHGENIVTFYVGDVSGKGMSASLCRSACLSLLKLASRISLDPAGVVSEVNETLASREIDGRYATLVYGRLDLASGRLRLLSAGHPNPIRVSRFDRAEVLECSPCLPVGILSGHTYVVSEFSLEPGDTLLLYTNGITDARNVSRQFFGQRSLIELAQNMNSTFPRLLVERIMERVDSFSPNLRDDQTVMAMIYEGLSSEFSTNRLDVNTIGIHTPF